MASPHSPAVREINRTILEAEAQLFARHLWLRRQDLIGAAIWTVSAAAAVGLALAYFSGLVPAWLVVLGVAFCTSMLHELEHDLIHNLYFRARPAVQNLMLAGIWVLKIGINPWLRRRMHLLHHRESGQVVDIEERLIGLGVRSLPLRLLVAFVPPASALLLPRALREARRHGVGAQTLRDRSLLALVRGAIDGVFLGSYVVVPVAAALGAAWAGYLMVALVGPNMLRHGCLVLMSSYSHYYGDVTQNDVFEQNQILRHPLLWPLQLFCAGFGATHIVHHYVVNQPFYVRLLVSRAGLAAMQRHGVRVDDFGVVARANRRGPLPAAG